MNTKDLREKLFSNFFEVKEGIELSNIKQLTEEIRITWQEFHHLIRNNIKYYYKQEKIQEMKVVSAANRNFLFLKLHICDYLVLDLDAKTVVKKEEARNIFNYSFFIENFNESEEDIQNYLFFNTCKNPQEIIDFYIEKENILKLPSSIYYLTDAKEFSYCFIDLVGCYTHFGFYTTGLKEQYFLNHDFHFINLEYVKNRLGKTKAMEFNDKLPTIIIPYEAIPKEILEIKTLKRERKIKE